MYKVLVAGSRRYRTRLQGGDRASRQLVERLALRLDPEGHGDRHARGRTCP